MTPKQKTEYIKLHIQNANMLSDIVGGKVDQKNPQEITFKNASCLIAKIIFNNSKMLSIVNKGE